jgi:hypothetical protein
LDHDVTFNADRVSTPALFSGTFGGDDKSMVSSQGLHTLGSWWLNHKIVDYVNFPGAAHQMQWPSQQRAMMTLVVDWMSFWFLGSEDTAPDKQQHYSRWKLIRDAANENEQTRSSTKNGYIVTRSGLHYKITGRRVGEKVPVGSTVTFRYRVLGDKAKLTKAGTLHETLSVRLSPEVDNPALDEIAGASGNGARWIEGLYLLHEGEKAIFGMSDSGDLSTRSTAGSSAELTFYEVEILSVERVR